MNNPCADLVIPKGSISVYHLSPGQVDIPEGWRLCTPSQSAVMPYGDEAEGINPYQPDLIRQVILEKI